ncbi:hypothetical protein [Brevibacillus sp. SYSU BS000544]|uniref:hypothetical protein n=1 Tax=Brevibacillus sp. SYSU BS000544 TaxID=3416443 RepID=UPI003CE4853E
MTFKRSLVTVLLVFIALIIYWFRISPILDVDSHIAGEIEGISHVFLLNNQTQEYQLITTDQQEIKALVKEIKWTWNRRMENRPDNEASYEIIFDDNDNPTDGHNGFITYFPQADVFFFYDHKKDWLQNMESTSLIKELYLRTVSPT